MRFKTSFLLFSCLLAGAFFAHHRGYVDARFFWKAPQKSFQTEPIKRRTILRKKVFSGSLMPRKEVQVESHLTGVVDALFVQPGELVQPGKILARIAIQPDVQAVERAKHALQLASLAFQRARTNYLRHKQLFAKKMIAKAEYESVLADCARAKQELSSAKKQLQIVQCGYVKSKSTRGNAIKATSKGTVLALPVREGGAVKGASSHASGTVVAVVADLDEFLFTARVSEIDVVHLKQGMALQVVLNADKARKLRVLLTRIASKASAEALSRGEVQFEIEGVVQAPKQVKASLRAGYLALAEAVVQKATNVLSVPEKWIHAEGKDYFVWCLQSGEKVKKPVVLGLSDGLHAEVTKGLDETDQLIVE